MLNRVHTAAAARAFGERTPAAATKPAGGAGNAFSQQLLSVIQNAAERLGAAPETARVVRAETAAEEPGVKGSPRCQDSAAGRGCEGHKTGGGVPACETTEATPAAAGAADGADAMPEVLFEQHDGWNWRNYATYEMAQWLARRLGGEVGTYEADWSPGFEPPPTYYTIRFGEIEMNAGQLAVYYQPGDYVEPDRMAAMLMAGEGVNNSFVSGHFPELSRA